MAHPSEFFKPKPAAAEPAHVAGHPRDFFKTEKPAQPATDLPDFTRPAPSPEAVPPMPERAPDPAAAAAEPAGQTKQHAGVPPTIPPTGGASIFGNKKSGGIIDGEVDVIYLSPNNKNWAGYPWVNLTFVEWIESSNDEDDTLTFIFGKQTVKVSGKRFSRLAEIVQTRKVARIGPSIPGGEFKREEWVRKVEIIEAAEEEDDDE